MAWLTGSLSYLLPFLVTLTVLVFVHELGHYLIARWNGVRVDTFSIGFGPELIGWTDGAGTRWKVSALPLGGYVKMFGDADAASMPGAAVSTMTDAEKAVSFHHKRLPQRAAVIAGGPGANFLFAVVVFAVLFATIGQPSTAPEVGPVKAGSAAEVGGIRSGDVIVAVDGHRVERFEDVMRAEQTNAGTPMQILLRRDGEELTLTVTPRVNDQVDRFGNRHQVTDLGIGPPFTVPEVGQVSPGSAAAAAGIIAGDVIVAINGHHIDHFEDLQQIVQRSPGVPLEIEVRRDGQQVSLSATPDVKEDSDSLGNHRKIGILGIAHSNVTKNVRYNPATALLRASEETWNLTVGTLDGVWQMIIGLRSSDGVSGPVGIVRMSGEVAQGGFLPLVWFAAVLSINLGLINLFPIPVLDGGHLLFYAAEAIRGRPLGQRAQEYGFRLGLALVLTLMVFATWNDLARLKVVEFIKGLVT
jgi:regulator of sigma E protease